jgi:hypothetical protein
MSSLNPQVVALTKVWVVTDAPEKTSLIGNTQIARRYSLHDTACSESDMDASLLWPEASY